jgi:hypothetical protein
MRTPPCRVRVNQVLFGKPAEIVTKLKAEGYFQTTSQAINEAVIVLGDLYVERQLKLERLRALGDEKE